MEDPKNSKINRREFVELSVQGVVGASLSTLPVLGSAGCFSDDIKTIHGACYLDCPDRCSWKMRVVNNEITEFKASTDHPYTDGRLCNKMDNFPNDVTYHPSRLLTPLKMVGKKGNGEFEPITWDKAISEIAAKLNNIISSKGGEAVLPFSYGGNQGIVQGGAVSNRFFAHIGATQLQRTICGDAAVAGVLATNGQTTGVLPENIVHSQYIILWGTNPVLSNQHLWLMIEKAKKKGAKVIVIDPFVSQTAALADWHIQPNPGTDTALALGLINVILAEKLEDRDYINKYTSGIEELTKHVQKYSPEFVARITGLEKESVVTLAREYAQSSPSLIRVLIGMEHQANGASAFRTVAMLPSIIGAWRYLGGGLMHMTYELFGSALNWESANLPESMPKPTTRTVNMVQLGRALNDIDSKSAIHALFVFNANPVVTIPHQNLIIKGMKREDLMTVVLEHTMTDTARYADYILPSTTVLENWDILDSWGIPFININQPAIKPLGQSKPNTEFFRLLSREMGFKESYLYETDLDIVKKTLKSDHEYLKGITFDSLQKTGWARLNVPQKWMPHAEGNFGTPTGKCLFLNPDVDPPLPDYMGMIYSEEEMTNYPLQLLSIKTTKHFLNSSHAHLGDRIKKEGYPTLDIHEKDAEKRGIADGDEIKVFNKRGIVILTASIRKKVKPGVVCMPQGFWPTLMKGGSSANALTDDLLTDMGGSAALQETRVEVQKS